jgi:hypothetical protein
MAQTVGGWEAGANPISFKQHRFAPDVIRYAAWLYFRFTLSNCDVEELRVGIGGLGLWIKSEPSALR